MVRTKSIRTKSITLQLVGVNYHNWVLSVCVRYILKFYDKTLPRRP